MVDKENYPIVREEKFLESSGKKDELGRTDASMIMIRDQNWKRKIILVDHKPWII